MFYVGQKWRQKLVILNFLGYLGEFKSDSQTGPAYALLRHGQCFQFSSPNLQWLTSFDSRKLYPLFGWPTSYRRVSCFWLAGWRFSTWKHKFHRLQQRESHFIFPFFFFFFIFPIAARYGVILSRFCFWNSLKTVILQNIVFPLVSFFLARAGSCGRLCCTGNRHLFVFDTFSLSTPKGVLYGL